MTTRLAVPLFHDEVAPRFCDAARFRIVDVAQASVTSTRDICCDGSCWAQNLARLAHDDVSVLLCGGFNRRFLPMAGSLGIQVIWGLTGPVDDVVDAFCKECQR
jgi:predicted Fe-Mo cluster-binding NifX family protein